MQQERYCRSCGQELQPEDQFCGSCGKPVLATAHVPTPEADVPVPPPTQGEDRSAPPQAPQTRPSEAEIGRGQDAPIGPILGMVAVFLVLWVGVTIQERPPDPPGKDWGDKIGYQIGAGGVHAFQTTPRVGAIIVTLGGVYYLTGHKRGVTFRKGVFNWPLVIVAAIVTFFMLLL